MGDKDKLFSELYQNVQLGKIEIVSEKKRNCFKDLVVIYVGSMFQQRGS